MNPFIAAIVLTFGILVIPLASFLYLRQRGKERWAVVTLATGLLGFGWLVGLVGVIVASINPPAEPTHVYPRKQQHVHS